MSHHTYTTAAFVLGGVDVGEGSRSLVFYTRELGLLYGLARSVREVRSKLRFALQPLSLCEVSLVRGRDVWRVTGARAGINYYHVLQDAPHKLALLARVFSLARRLIRGEEPGGEVFELFEEGLTFLVEEELNKEELALFECLFIFKLLHLLGYVASFETRRTLPDEKITRELLVAMASYKKKLVHEINKSLTATQL